MLDPARMRANRIVAAILIIVAAIAIRFLAGSRWHRDFGPTGSENDAVPTTIAQVRSHPANFAGKRVKLAGKLDECFGWECSLCPEAMTTQARDPERCLALSFRPLIPGTGFGSDEQETVFRFANVVLTAKFDPSCWQQGTCLDRQTVLEDAQVLAVGERRSSSNGLWLGTTSRLSEVNGLIFDQVRAAAFAAGFPKGPPIRVFRSSADASKLVVCWTSLSGEAGSWPSVLEGVYAQSKADFYRCNAVREVDGRYVLQAEG